MKLKKIVLALGLTAAISAPVVASAIDWGIDALIIGAGVAGGPVPAVVALGYVGYSEGAFKSLGWSEKHWIDDVDFEKNMPAGYINTTGIALAWVNSCAAAGGKPTGYVPVATTKDWFHAMQLAAYRNSQHGDQNASYTSYMESGKWDGGSNDSVSKTSFDDSDRATRKAASVELLGSTHVGMNCVGVKQIMGSAMSYSIASYEAWVSKKDGKFHVIQEDQASGLRIDTLSVSEAIRIGKYNFDKAGLQAKKFD